ncbi:MAG: SDR family NAD(P)-dependent oxidoreductase [Pseudomonadota bacterium]
MFDFKNKTAAITGGATGIGFALAKALGKRGAKIVIGEPREERLAEAKAALEKLGIETSTTHLDVTNPESMEAFADFAWNTYGSVDLAINNAGISVPRKSITQASLEDLHAVMDVNFFGVWHGCASFGRRMSAQDTPSAIYNVASENAFFTAVKNSAGYVASKHAVMGMTEAFREEMPDHVTVGTIFPGFVHSEMTGDVGAQLGMNTDEFAEIVVNQIETGERFIVSHAYNIEHITARYEALKAAFERSAPRYEGDDEYDVPSLMRKFSG